MSACENCYWVSGHHPHCYKRNHPTTQARSQAATRERSDVLASVAALIEEITRLREDNALFIEALRFIKGLCVAERAQ